MDIIEHIPIAGQAMKFARLAKAVHDCSDPTEASLKGVKGIICRQISNIPLNVSLQVLNFWWQSMEVLRLVLHSPLPQVIKYWKKNYKNYFFLSNQISGEPYAVKVARTVLQGSKASNCFTHPTGNRPLYSFKRISGSSFILLALEADLQGLNIWMRLQTMKCDLK